MRRAAFLLVFLLTTAAAQAAHYADTYVIPIAGHTRGANNTMWMTDLAIRNFGTEPLTVEILVIESGNDTLNNVHPLMTDSINGSVTVGVNSTVMLADVLEGHRGLDNVTGALVLGANRPFAVTSRSYNSAAGIGQTVPATRDFLDNSAGTIDNATIVYLPGIMQNANARTNIGFVAGAGGSNLAMTVEITIRNATGGVVGSRQFVIQQGSFAHHQFNVRSILSNAATQFDIGSADVRIVEGEGTVVPYASVVDNRTGEAAYVMGQFPNSTPPAMNTLQRNLFQSLFNAGRGW